MKGMMEGGKGEAKNEEYVHGIEFSSLMMTFTLIMYAYSYSCPDKSLLKGHLHSLRILRRRCKSQKYSAPGWGPEGGEMRGY